MDITVSGDYITRPLTVQQLTSMTLIPATLRDDHDFRAK